MSTDDHDDSPEFSLDERQLTEVRRELMQLPARKRLAALLEPRDAGALVRALPAADLYLTIHDLGLADATDLVQLVSPEQFQVMVDLAAWKSTEVDEHAFLLWLRAAWDPDGEGFIEKLMGVDLELLEILLLRMIRVHDLEEDPDVNPDGVTMSTPEGRYLIEFLVEGIEQAAIRQVIDALISRDPFEAVRLFEAVRWEVPTELEEAALQFRSARLSELGFPPLEEALSLYAYRDPEPYASERTVRDETALAQSSPPDLLSAGLRGLDQDERDTLEAQLRLLSNQALVAEGAEPGDVEAQRQTLEQVRDTLQLGLEFITGGAPDAAATALRAHHLRHLFQVGFSLGLKLRFRADRLLKQPLARAGGIIWLMPPEARTVSGLRRRRPVRVLEVEGAEPVAFRSRREVYLTSLALNRAEAQVAIFSMILGGREEEAKGRLEARAGSSLPVDPASIWAGALAHTILSGAPGLDPISPSSLGALVERALDAEGRVRPEARASAMASLASRVPEPAVEELERLVDQELARWSDELGPPRAKGSPLEPIAGVVLPLAVLQ